MLNLRLHQIAQWTGGRLHGEDARVTGVTTDTRKLAHGDLFVALKGERVDAHDFLELARSAGAAAALVARPLVLDLPQVVVADTERALGDLAAAVRRTRADGPVRLEEAWGPAMTPDPAGYRLLLDYASVFRLIRAERPAVLEAGDPWLTGLFCLFLRRTGIYRGLLVSFYHSDPIPSYLEPWAARGGFRAGKLLLARILAPLDQAKAA